MSLRVRLLSQHPHSEMVLGRNKVKKFTISFKENINGLCLKISFISVYQINLDGMGLGEEWLVSTPPWLRNGIEAKN